MAVTEQPQQQVRLKALVSGFVQGVGFRYWVYGHATELGLVGSATNLVDGRVQVIAQGSLANCTQLLNRLSEQPSQHGRRGTVTGVLHTWHSPEPQLTGFSIR